jgi:DNA-binding transcriptional regulator YiaG
MKTPKNTKLHAATRQTWTATTPQSLAVLASLTVADDLPPVGGRQLIRELAGLTLDDVATVLLTSPATVHQWEKGKRDPSGPSRYAYGLVLGKLLAIPSVALAYRLWVDAEQAEAAEQGAA